MLHHRRTKAFQQRNTAAPSPIILGPSSHQCCSTAAHTHALQHSTTIAPSAHHPYTDIAPSSPAGTRSAIQATSNLFTSRPGERCTLHHHFPGAWRRLTSTLIAAHRGRGVLVAEHASKHIVAQTLPQAFINSFTTQSPVRGHVFEHTTIGRS